jgi:phosphatidylserine/phosphatidylglycerophosphate/cardiolipin synthase-like enzyme
MREVERELILFAPYWRAEGVNMLVSAAGRLDYSDIRILVVTQSQHHMREEDRSGLLHFMELMSAAKAIVEVIAPKPNNSGTPFAHAKLLIADGGAAYVGSANFTSSGMRHGLEAGVIVSSALAWEFVQWINSLKYICEPWGSSYRST